MKKIFCIALVMATLFLTCSITNTEAQTSIPTTASKTDTATNATDKYQVFSFKGTGKNLSLQSTLTKISGTTAGFVIVQKSIDGINYTNMGYDDKGKDTLTLANQATNTATWQYQAPQFPYYRIWIHPTGTQSTQAKGYILFR